MTAAQDLAGVLFDLCDTKQRQDGTLYVSSTDDRVLKVTYAAHDAVLACHALSDEFAHRLGVLRPDGSWGES